MERQVHSVEAAIQEREAPVTAQGGVKGGDIVADVMPDDHPVTEIVEKLLQRFGLVDPLPALVSSHAVHGDRFRVPLHAQQRIERILQQDFAIDHGNGSDRDDPVGRGIQPEARIADRFVYGWSHRAIPDRNRKQPGLGDCDGRNLVERHAGAIRLDHHGLEQARAGPAGPQALQFVAQRRD